jgi:hypothetical protein
MRSRALHEEWLASLDCEVLRIEGIVPTGEQVEMVMARQVPHRGRIQTSDPGKSRRS